MKDYQIPEIEDILLTMVSSSDSIWYLKNNPKSKKKEIKYPKSKEKRENLEFKVNK